MLPIKSTGNPTRQKFPEGILGNYWLLGENFWEFKKNPILVISCCELWKLADMRISLTISISADANMTDLIQREHPNILAGIGPG